MEIEPLFEKNILIDEKEVVQALVYSSEEKVKAFIDIVSSEYPEKSVVENIEVEYIAGNVMKIESYYRYLIAMPLSKIATYGGKMLEKQAKMLDKQDKMLTKQDESLKILTNINNDTSEMKSTLKTTEMDIRGARFSLTHLIETKFKEHDADIAQIKTALAKVKVAIKAT